jgi:hypothetical protein
MIQEYYRQMRKFGCNILAVVQQTSLKIPVRGAIIGNSKMFITDHAESHSGLIGRTGGLTTSSATSLGCPAGP